MPVKANFIMIFNHEVWNWGKPQEYSECEIKALKEEQNKEESNRKKEVFETIYKKQNDIMDNLKDLSELSENQNI